MKHIVLIILSLFAFTAEGQVNYEKRIKNGVVTYTPETVPGSQVYDGTPVTSLPSGAATSRLSTSVRKAWTPESQKRTLNLAQFGTSGTKSVFKLSCDFRPAEISHAQWRKLGFNMISKWTSNQEDGSNQFNDVPDSEKFDYETESSLHGPYEGHGFYANKLETIESWYIGHVPSYGPGAHWTANIETSNYWPRDAYKNDDGSGGWSHYPRWIDVKNDRVDLESGYAISAFGKTQVSIEELFSNPTAQDIEAGTRYSNRVSIMLKIAGKNGAYASFGSSAYQGEPRTNALTTSDRFRDNYGADVSHIGGSGGTITLNGRTYTGISGSFYQHETCHLDYHYYFDYTFTGGDQNAYNAIDNYPALWPLIFNRHPIAREVGHWLANQKRLKDVHGGNTIPSVRMHELFYEGNFSRAPYAMNVPNGDGGPAKTWIPPYLIRLQYILTHFLEGEKPGSGYHIFHAEGAPNQGIVYNLSSKQRYNHHLHTISALIAARRDMESILDKINGSTLYTDLSIKVGNTGSFQTINGVSAYAMGPGGEFGTTLPCFVMRTKATSEGLYVLIAGGYDQGWNDTRTDAIQIPGQTNEIQVTYKGKDLQVFETLIPTETVGQVFKAQSIVSQWSKPGYGGRINNNGLELWLALSIGAGGLLQYRKKFGIRQRKPTQNPKIRTRLNS